MALHNVYIFNNIENNDADVSLLRGTFTRLGCSVREIKNAPLDDLKKFVSTIVEADFFKFNYIVIVILDNTNEDNGIWMSTDGKPFHINGDLLTELYANPHLKGKLRLTIVQMNRIFSDRKPILRNFVAKKCYPCIDVKYFSTSLGETLIHKWDKAAPSPFIRILCEEIGKNIRSERNITDILNNISKKVELETGELPSKEMGVSGCIFGHATENVLC